MEKSPKQIGYDPQLALKLFQVAGETETFPAGKQVFAERDKPGGFFAKGAKVYLLLEGQVALTLKGKPLNLVLPGEIFGELALISDAARSATATVHKNAKVLSLDEKRLLASLPQVPEFALMLIASMVQQLRRTIDRVLAVRPGPLPTLSSERGLDKRQLATFRTAMHNPALRTVAAGDPIVLKGAVGIFMYVVMDGQIEISADGHVIENIGPGGIFGETALLGAASRAASATAVTAGAWLPVSRDDFLEVVRTHPAIGMALLRSMSERIQHVSQLLGG